MRSERGLSRILHCLQWYKLVKTYWQRQHRTELDGVKWSVAYVPLAATRHKSSQAVKCMYFPLDVYVHISSTLVQQRDTIFAGLRAGGRTSSLNYRSATGRLGPFADHRTAEKQPRTIMSARCRRIVRPSA